MTNVVTTDSATTQEFLKSVKAKQQVMWSSGDYAVIGTTLQIVGEALCEAVDLRAGERVLDVAAGNGNATLAAARRFARVTSTDYVPALLDRGKRRAEADGFDVVFEPADAEALQYGDASFDVVLSTFGVMFAPAHDKTSSEMMRVTKPGGRVGLACWTPQGFLGDVFRTIGKHVPPPAGVSSPLLWGTDAHLRSLFADASAIEHTARYFSFRYQSPEHWVDVFRTYYGPVHKAFAALDAEHQAALEADLLAVLRKADRGGSKGLVIPAEYLEIVITK
jgi:ubiquinone/menaquinone biosynthesis C-methylase UbiE